MADVDTLGELAELLGDAREKVKSERLNESSRLCYEAAILCAEAPMPRDGWIRQSAEVRQWLKEARDFDKADADRRLAALTAKAQAKKERAAKRAQMRAAKRGNLKVV